MSSTFYNYVGFPFTMNCYSFKLERIPIASTALDPLFGEEN